LGTAERRWGFSSRRKRAEKAKILQVEESFSPFSSLSYPILFFMAFLGAKEERRRVFIRKTLA